MPNRLGAWKGEGLMKDRIIAISIALGLMGSITIEDAQAEQADANNL